MDNIRRLERRSGEAFNAMAPSKQKESSRWSKRTAERMTAVRSRLATLIFLPPSRFSASELAEVVTLHEELTQLEACRHQQNKIRPTL